MRLCLCNTHLGLFLLFTLANSSRTRVFLGAQRIISGHWLASDWSHFANVLMPMYGFKVSECLELLCLNVYKSDCFCLLTHKSQKSKKFICYFRTLFTALQYRVFLFLVCCLPNCGASEALNRKFKSSLDDVGASNLRPRGIQSNTLLKNYLL